MKASWVFAPIAVAAMTLFAAANASAAACTGVDVGTSTTSDVTLGGVDSTSCVVAIGNTGQGGGNVDLVNTAFGDTPSWTVLANGDTSGFTDSFDTAGVHFDFTFSLATNTWTLTTDQNVSADFVFALHGGNRSGMFLFEDKALGPTQEGTWEINFVNNGGNNPAYSNVTLFARDVTPLTAVPEPSTYALMLAGLGVVGMMARRRRQI